LLAEETQVLAVTRSLVVLDCLRHQIKMLALLLDSRVLRDQELKERRQQRFASLADVVHELEESQVDREFLLGNTPMRAQPTPQERPISYHPQSGWFEDTPLAD